MEKAKMDQKAHVLLSREIKNMEEMHHPNIIRIFEYIETLSKLYITMEFAGGGELYVHVLNEGRLQENEAKKLYAQIVAGHENLIIHRDIKAENVFFAGQGWVKLGDFGFSAQIEPGTMMNTFCGSPPYAAPELFRDKEYMGEYVDIWALGILLYFMVVGNTPFRGETVVELKRHVLEGFFTIPDHVTPFCQELLNGILRMDPLQRYTLGELQTHYWIGTSDFPEEYIACSTVPNLEEGQTNPVVAKTFDRLHKLGLTDEQLNEAAQKGSKNQTTGTYRITLFQAQRQAEHEQKLLDNENTAASKTTGISSSDGLFKKTSSRLCAIL